MTLRTRMMLVIMLVFWVANGALAVDSKEATQEKKQPEISISEKIGDKMVQEATRVKEDIERQARSMFERKPLGWNWDTIDYLYKWMLGLPLMIPQIVKNILEQSRVLGFAGSLIMLTFIVAVLYSLLGRDRVLTRIEAGVQPLRAKMPEVSYPYFISALKVVVAALIPLLLLGAFALINAMITYKAAWFQLTGRLLVLWAIGALLISLLRESLTRDLFQATARYGEKIFNLARLAALYVILGIAISWGAEVFPIRIDVLALLKFAVSLSIVIVLFLLLLRKKALLSFFPELPYRSYQGYIRMLDRYYYPLIFLSFLLSLLWCIGYKQLSEVLLGKIWSAAGVYLLITLVYHMLRGGLQRWQAKVDPSNEAAQFLARSLKALLAYATIAASAIILLELLGLMNPLQRLLSFPIIKLGETQVTLWIIVKAAFILTAFIYGSRLLQAVLDYKIYPSIGVDPGLGYALNTFFKYLTLAVGFLITLKIVGLDLRFLLVFAGAAGIGIGLGLQNMAANVFSGFTIIFGRKIRKGDWIEVGDTLGVVTDIHLRATNVRDRDNIEYLIPNSNLISDTVVNYSLTSSMIRIELPVGVSYAADPQKVQEILVAVAEQEPMVTKFRKPEVRFTAYGDNSINFELLIWIDVRKTARRAVRSALYFKIFEELRKAGIEIPFPQRDIHIRSQVEPGQAEAPEAGITDEE
ncbi:MAG: mechanosensitive ion channel [Desulfobacterales bacterium]